LCSVNTSLGNSPVKYKQATFPNGLDILSFVRQLSPGDQSGRNYPATIGFASHVIQLYDSSKEKPGIAA